MVFRYRAELVVCNGHQRRDFLKCLNEIGPQVVVKVAHNKHSFDYGDLRSVPVWSIVAQDLVFAH